MAANLADILESTGFPVAYLQFKSPPVAPYIVYYAEDDDNFAADNVVYYAATNYIIELYSDLKDPASEALIEAALTANDMYYEKTEAWIESEELYQVVYSV